MVLFWKLWYYTENYGTILKIMKLPFTKEKNNVELTKTMNLWFIMENTFANMPKQLKFFNKYIAVKLWFTMEKLWYYGKKTMVLYWKLLNVLIYYGKKNSGFIVNYRWPKT